MSLPPAQRDERQPIPYSTDEISVQLRSLKEHQKTAIRMFTENGINPVNIVKATKHGGVQNLLQEAERIAGVADAWRTLYGIDINPLVRIYNKYGRNVVEVCLVELVHMSQQGLLPVKQDFASEAIPTGSSADDEDELLTSTDKIPDHLVKPAGRGSKPASTEDGTPRDSSFVGKRPLSEATTPTTAKRSAPPFAFIRKRRAIGQVCSPSCTKYIKRRHFFNHALLKHKNKLPSQMAWLCCCDNYYTDDEDYLDHQWTQHSDVTTENEAGVTLLQQSDGPCSASSTPARAFDNGEP